VNWFLKVVNSNIFNKQKTTFTVQVHDGCG
jgi:hypothetical protein